jgi:predicted CXXCH cytochrome family protein
MTTLLLVGMAAAAIWPLARWAWKRHRALLLPGKTSYGHRLIEDACFSCHLPWSGAQQQSCLGCHGRALEAMNDTHRAARFDDPVNAAELQRLNVLLCVTCHREHRPEITDSSSTTVPKDFCVVCHQDVATDRPSHRTFDAAGCASTGCHHYHDNRALYTDLLRRRKDEPDLRPSPRAVPSRDRVASGRAALTALDADGPATTTDVTRDWARSAHASAGVNCTGCHQATTSAGKADGWTRDPGDATCRRCHEVEAAAFSSGRHGMRVAVGLPPLTPALATLPMRPGAAHRAVTCGTCHTPHALDVSSAAVEACESCHADDHTRAYRGSPHFALWQLERQGIGSRGSGVSCATCHLPRVFNEDGGTRSLHADHDQSRNLRPSEEMALEVCDSCHGLPFSLAALADPLLIRSNFTGRPAAHLAGIDLVRGASRGDQRR